jgi:small-conductance mechanosensitive channel
LTQKLCPEGRARLVLSAMTLIFLLATAGGGLIAWRSWTRAGRKWPDESANKIVRSRFMAALGLLISVLCFFGIVAQWIPQLFFNPCQR